MMRAWALGRLFNPLIPRYCNPLARLAAISTRAEAPAGSYTPITQQLWMERLENEGNHRTQHNGQHGKKLVYKFTTDKLLQELYRNPWGALRIGRVMEDLDSLAGSIAYEHCVTPKGPPLLVTASVDEITLQHPVSVKEDIVLQGHVVWTGSSSLDILVTLKQPHYDTPSLTGLFSFVNLDPATRKAAPVSPVPIPSLGTPLRAIYDERQRVADARKAARRAAVGPHADVVPPEARTFMAPLLAEYRRQAEMPALAAAAGAIPMPDTSLQNTFVCQPQQRNMHGTIFGGFLMRRAYELAFATTYTFGGARPVFLKCDEITFRRPVDVGDLLRLRSAVTHTLPEQGLVFVEVEATVAKPERADFHVTNTFAFVFRVDLGPSSGRKLARVLPTHEEEGHRAWRAHCELSQEGAAPTQAS